jgi:2-oxo-4-hydroxy-4-carboxy--5-ureidoimidazoline (OHCU) decarboxylase
MPRSRETRRFDPAPRTMALGDFVEKFGGVYEHFPEIAMRAFGNGLTPATDRPAGLAAAMAKVAFKS